MNLKDAATGPEGTGVPLLLRLGGARHRCLGSPGCEIAPCPPATAVPGCPDWLLGVIVHKGEALPLVDLTAALNEDLPAAGGEPRRMLVNRSGGLSLAFRVDDVDADDGRAGAAPLDLDTVSRNLLARSAAWVAR